MDKVAILYGGGCYGNFVHWCIQYFSGSDITLPFNQNGNSHKTDIGDFKFSKKFIYFDRENNLSSYNQNIVYGHPKTIENTKIINIIEKILDTDRKIIFLNCSKKSFLLNINNKFTKIFSDGWLESNNPSSISQFNKTINELSLWEKREFLSFYIFKQHESETEYQIMNSFTNENFLSINIENLFDDFESTIRKIFSFINLKIERTNFEEIYSEWTKLQYYKDSDKNAKEVLRAILEDRPLDWSDKNLSIIDEAWVQHQLRDEHDIEIRCWRLDKFPTSTDALRPYLIHQNV